ncbi:MAG: M48 family metallopeptidase [Mycoplasmataceae bacterium]|nr:M48 family metallopeptidase [Mycoplasmataceae bacterium]
MNAHIRLVFAIDKYVPIHIYYSRSKHAIFYIDRTTNNLCLQTTKKDEEQNIQQLVIPNINAKLSLINRKEEKIAIDINQTRFCIFEKTYTIKQANLKPSIKYEIIFNTIYLNSHFNKQQIIKEVYTDIVSEYMLRRVKYWQIKMGLTKNKIIIKFNWMKYCYAHCKCSGHNTYTITFSNYICACNKESINDTIIHELAHTVHMNHKKQFWDVVKKYSPETYRIWISNHVWTR